MTPAQVKTLSTRQAALFYAALGWPIFPVWPMRGGACGCGKPDCPNPGKHPLGSLAPHGFKDAATDADIINQWWDKCPDANIGLATGAASGVFAVDIDPRHNGADTWQDLEAAKGPIPDTVEQETGGGGRHILFKYVAGLGNSSSKLGPGIDTRGDGGYILLPPSSHISGRRYEWEASSHPGEVPLADMPAWLSGLLTVEQRNRRQPVTFSSNGNGKGRVVVSHPAIQNSDRVIAALAQKEAERLLREIIAAPDGQKHDTLNKNGYILGGYVGAGYFGRETVLGWLEDAIDKMQNVESRKGALRTALDSVTAGEKEPLTVDIPVLTYRPEDGGVLDAWRDLWGADWLFVAGFEQWHAWAGTHWQARSSYAVKAEIQNLLDALNRKARELVKNALADEQAKAWGAWVSATKRTRARVDGVEGLARNALWGAADRLDSASLLNLANGSLDLQSGALRPHERGDYLTYCLPYSYDPAAQAPNWERFLSRLDPELVAFLQEFAGYALTPDTQYEVAVWLYGPPGGGKSTFLAGLRAMLGPKAVVLGLADIERNRFALTDLPGKTLALSTEQPGDYIASTHVLDAIISGEPVRVERKFADGVTITPRAKVAWAMNDFPRVGNANDGIFRRVKVVEFPAIPENEREPGLKEALKHEGAAILNWALEGLKRLQVRGRFHFPQAVTDATLEFANQNDIPRQFVEERCLVDAACKTGANALYQAYKDWAQETGHKSLSTTRIAGEWKRLGFESFKANGRVFWRGVGLKNTPDA